MDCPPQGHPSACSEPPPGPAFCAPRSISNSLGLPAHTRCHAQHCTLCAMQHQKTLTRHYHAIKNTRYYAGQLSCSTCPGLPFNSEMTQLTSAAVPFTCPQDPLTCPAVQYPAPVQCKLSPARRYGLTNSPARWKRPTQWTTCPWTQRAGSFLAGSTAGRRAAACGERACELGPPSWTRCARCRRSSRWQARNHLSAQGGGRWIIPARSTILPMMDSRCVHCHRSNHRLATIRLPTEGRGGA